MIGKSASVQPKITAGRTLRVTSPSHNLFNDLTFAFGAHNFFQVSPSIALAKYLIGQHPLQASVLTLEFVQLLGLIDFKHPHLTLPAW